MPGGCWQLLSDGMATSVPIKVLLTDLFAGNKNLLWQCDSRSGFGDLRRNLVIFWVLPVKHRGLALQVTHYLEVVHVAGGAGDLLSSGWTVPR